MIEKDDYTIPNGGIDKEEPFQAFLTDEQEDAYLRKTSDVNCDHIITVGKEGETGSFCAKCGIKVLEVETRKCSECKHYKKLYDGSICTDKLMSVIPDMLVTYYVEKGTCFEYPRLKP